VWVTMSQEAKFRKLQYDLRAYGLGIFLFGFWAAVRVCLTAILVQTEREQLDEIASEGLASAIVIYAILVVIVLAIIALHGYVALCARAEANGKRKWLYLVLSAGIAVLRVFSVLNLSFNTENLISWDMAEVVITCLVDLSELSVAVGLIIVAVRLKRMRKMIEKEN